MKIYVLLFSLLILVVSGCQIYSTVSAGAEYTITDISREKTDIDHNERNSYLRIYYTVNNNAELTLSPKIQIKLNESCFNGINEKELGSIPPKQNVRQYTTLNLRYDVPNYCINKVYQITLVLKDVNGKILDTEAIPVGIV